MSTLITYSQIQTWADNHQFSVAAAYIFLGALILVLVLTGMKKEGDK